MKNLKQVNKVQLWFYFNYLIICENNLISEMKTVKKIILTINKDENDFLNPSKF